MRRWSNFKNTQDVINLPEADASKFKNLTSSTWGYVYEKAIKAKGTSIPTNESQVKNWRVLIFFEWHERSKGHAYHSSDLFKNILRIRRFIYPNFIFGRCVVEMIDLSRTKCSLVAWSQSAFFSLEFRPNKAIVLAWPSRVQCELGVKILSLHMFYYTAFQLPKLNFDLCCKALQKCISQLQT